MKLMKLNKEGGIDRYPYTLRMLKNDNPDVSLPKNPSDETLAALGAVRVESVPRPDGDVVTEGQPELVDGVWRQTWASRPFTQAELNAQYQASIPRAVTKRQAKEALIRNGLYQAALDALEGIVDPTEKAIAQNYWSESQEFQRANPVLTQMATAIGMTDADLDDLFLQASKL